MYHNQQIVKRTCFGDVSPCKVAKIAVASGLAKYILLPFAGSFGIRKNARTVVCPLQAGVTFGYPIPTSHYKNLHFVVQVKFTQTHAQFFS